MKFSYKHTIPMDLFFWIWPVRVPAAPLRDQPFSGSKPGQLPATATTGGFPSENLGRKSDGGGTVNRKLVPALVGILRCSAMPAFLFG